VSVGSKSSYRRSVATLAVGTAIAQALPVAVSPILTRLYSPDDFGLVALYNSILAIIAILATFRYELAIVLPKDDQEANNVVAVSLIAALATSIFVGLVVLLLGQRVSQLLGDVRLKNWLYLLPVSIFLTAAYTALNYWLNRREDYRRMSLNRISQSALKGAGDVTLGITSLGGVSLVFSSIVSQGLTLFRVVRLFWQEAGWQKLELRKFMHSAKKYAHHPLHLMPAQFIGAISMQVPIFLLTRVFDSTVTGFYSLGLRLISLPTTLIAGAIGDVYRQKASLRFNQTGEFRQLYLKTVSTTALIATPLYGALYFFAPTLFEIAFGAQWRVAGEYAQILSVAAFFQFVFTPLDKGALIVGATRYILLWHFLRLLAFGGLFLVTMSLNLEVKPVLWCFTAVSSALYLMEGVAAYHFSRLR